VFDEEKSMGSFRIFQRGALASIALIFTACFSTENGSDAPATYTKTITVDAVIDTHFDDDLGGDSVGLGFYIGSEASFSDREERNPGVYKLAFPAPYDSVLQIYFRPGSKEEWAIVSVRLDSLYALSDSLIELEEYDTAGVVGQKISDLSIGFDTAYTRFKKVPISACTFSAQGMTTTDEADSDAIIPLVVSVHVDEGLSLWIDQQASIPTGKPNFDFRNRRLMGTILVTCPNPLK
jgi:hypothetical protein